MARVKQTARKTTGGYVPPRAPATFAPNASAGPSRGVTIPKNGSKKLYHSKGFEAGKAPMILVEMLQRLGYTKAPVYHGLRQIYPGREEWTVEVCLYGSPEGDDNYEIVGIHKAMAVRASFEAGIRDAARQALARVCERHRSALRGTSYDYFPRRERGSRDIKVKATTHEHSGVAREQVLLATTLHEDLDEALDELQDTRKRLRDAEAQIRELQKSLNGMSSSSDSEDQSIRSPSPKRPRRSDPSSEESSEDDDQSTAKPSAGSHA
jgi:hypothetical protein